MEEPKDKTKPEGKLVVEEVAQEPAQVEKVIGEEKRGVFKKFWYVFTILGVIIALCLVFLVYGYLKLSLQKPASTPTPIPTPTAAEEVDEQTSDLEEQGTSDEIGDIEADLEETDLSEIDQELEDIESELSSP